MEIRTKENILAVRSFDALEICAIHIGCLYFARDKRDVHVQIEAVE
jgi:hypothetical protein